jgi:hypothetical protein
MKKTTGWLVRDPKGRVVRSGVCLVWDTRRDAIEAAWWPVDTNEDLQRYWRNARREGYTVERVEL